MGKWTRRAFIAASALTGGGLLLGIGIRPGNRAPKVADMVGQEGEHLLTIWVKIAPDNTVTAIVPHSEMGQGVHTSLPMMLADELDADWSLVKMMEAPAHEEYANYGLGKGFLLGPKDIPSVLVGTVDGAFLTLAKYMDLQITGGSTSVRFTGREAMRVAGAAARDMLLRAAAETWSVPVGELTAQKSYVYHRGSDRKASYADLAAAAARLDPPAKPRLKQPKEYTIMGTPIQRVDVPSKVDGSAQFGIDVTLPGMKYAAVKAAPIFGGSVAQVDTSAAEALPGVQKVVNLGTAVAVIADGYWQAQQALNRLDVNFAGGGNETVSSETIFAQFSRDMDAAVAGGDEESDVEIGDARATLANAHKVVEAEYRVPYLAHATMEPLNATAWIHDGICEVWTGNQNPLGFRSAIAEALEMDVDKVQIHNAMLGGGFGRRAIPDYAIQAARLAKQVSYPVKLIWSREEDIRQDHYRPAIASRFRAGLDAQGRPVAWENQFVDKHEPVEAPHIPYNIAHQFIHYVDSPTHVPFGPWRSVDHSQHGFFTESFVDEVAHAAGKDPYEFRRDLLADKPRHRKVLETAAEKAGWGQSLAPGRGRGIALQESFGSIVAQVAEVEVDDGGQVQVRRVVCVADCGFAVHPDGLIAQMESGIIYGLTAALYGEISIADGAVKQSNFHDYEMVRMPTTPKIETHIINSGAPLGGAGEPGTPAIAPALANAVFAVTGKRIRQLPVKHHDLRQGGGRS